MSASTTIRHRSPVTRPRGVGLLLLACVMLLPWGRAFGACNNVSSTPDVNFSPPASITVPQSAQVGDVIYQGPQVSPSQSISITCSGDSTYGIINQVGATPSIGTAIYPTTVSGVGYRLAHGSYDPGDYMYPWGCCELSSGTYQLTVTTALQLIKTGPIATGAVLPSGTLARWQYDRTGNRVMFVQDYVLSNAVAIAAPACQVSTSNIAVALPRISSTSLAAVDSTTGNTPFKISLLCSSGATLKIMFTTSAPVTGKTGVIASTTPGTAVGVGVQITSTAFNAITFGQVTTVGATPTGVLELPYNARYYRTGTITPGTVNATAMFTLSYD